MHLSIHIENHITTKLYKLVERYILYIDKCTENQNIDENDKIFGVSVKFNFFFSLMI